MSYDCIVATRNRLNALRMSIPLILKQNVLPGRLIIIDASDDHDSVRTEVHEISERLGFKDTIVAKSDVANSSRQRNMWYDGFAANVLKIYEADVRRQVGGPGGGRCSRSSAATGATRLQEKRICEREGGAAAFEPTSKVVFSLTLFT
jgi:hypothetical protein